MSVADRGDVGCVDVFADTRFHTDRSVCCGRPQPASATNTQFITERQQLDKAAVWRFLSFLITPHKRAPAELRVCLPHSVSGNQCFSNHALAAMEQSPKSGI